MPNRYNELMMNPNTNLLEKTEFRYPLQDVAEPKLYRTMFNYDEIPKIAFNRRLVPMNMPKDIWITDTTFRDGQQSREPYTTQQIVDLYDMLHRLSGPNGIVRQSEFFLYSKKDQDAVYKCMERGYQFPEVTSWIRASKKDFQMVKDLGMSETGILVSCSDYHIFYKLKMTRRQAIDHYLSVVRECIETGVKPRCHLEDITRADFYGFVVPIVLELSNLMKESGVPIKIRACDTLGYGVTMPGAALPRSVPGIIYGLNHHARIPSEYLEWHGHNDFYGAVNTATTAWLYGASAVNCSLLGIGERTGNCPLEAMVIEYAQLRGTLDGMDPLVITEIAEYYEKEIGYHIPERTPFVGADFNVTRAGVHADGLNKNEEIYNVFNTEKILGRPPKVMINNASGIAGVVHWINTHYEGQTITKESPIAITIRDWIDGEYAGGRVTSISDGELHELTKDLSQKYGLNLKEKE